MKYLLDTCIVEALLKAEPGHENVSSLLKKAWKAVRIERSEAESKYEWPAINDLARFDFAPVARSLS
ncbi:MAG: hypothetical protein HYV99_05365 [Betaproteobacteria bacterium]|nr:hypothetical protein [Betaproteobacteria bacterium]